MGATYQDRDIKYRMNNRRDNCSTLLCILGVTFFEVLPCILLVFDGTVTLFPGVEVSNQFNGTCTVRLIQYMYMIQVHNAF